MYQNENKVKEYYFFYKFIRLVIQKKEIKNVIYMGIEFGGWNEVMWEFILKQDHVVVACNK